MAYDPERSFGFLLHDIARLLRQPEFKKLEEVAEPAAISR
jgi:hypothetical protein